MDKNNYETYEYLPANNAATEQEQFFVLQDDGTFIINRQVQYVTQMQDDKDTLEDVQSCTVYDVAPQQFFIDVDNSAELISVPDNFILHNANSNLYTSNYLLQSVPSASTDQIDEEVAQDHHKDIETQIEVEVDVVKSETKQSNNCTEITLSDEQYNILEQRGWILLDINNKVFILDTLGLHDISANQELIQQLKTEETSSNPNNFESKRSLIKIDHTPSMITENDTGQETFNSQNAVELVINSDMKSETSDNIPRIVFIATEGKHMKEQSAAKEQVEKSKELFTQDSQNARVNPVVSKNMMKIKTKFIFKDIPDKIVLGKTANGKKLIAKVIRPKTDVRKESPNRSKLPKLKMKPSSIKHLKKLQSNVTQLQEWQLQNLVQQVLGEGPETKCSPEQVEYAENIIQQLLQIPTFQAISDNYIFVTKVVKKIIDDVCSESIIPSIVTGLIMGDNEKKFVYMPHLLVQLIVSGNLISAKEGSTDNSDVKTDIFKCPNLTFNKYAVHIHVTETKTDNNSVKVSITINKRKLPLSFREINKRQTNKVYACSSCAAIFKSEDLLIHHKKNYCLDTEDTLTIDTDNDSSNHFGDVKNKQYYVLKTDSGTTYACFECSARFNKLSNCQRHVKTHSNRNTKEETNSNGKTQRTAEKSIDNKPMYKCKICSSRYFHPSTLSKHIVASHINMGGPNIVKEVHN